MRRASLAAAFAVVMVAVGLWLLPRQNGSTALADMATAMAKVSTAHFMGFAVDDNGENRKLEGWVKGANRIRIRVEGTKDIADDGRRLIAVEMDRLPKVTIRVSGALPGLAEGMTYLDLFNGPGSLRSAMAANGAQVTGTKQVVLPDGRQGVMTELEGDSGTRMRIFTDARTNLLAKSETYNRSGELVECIRTLEYDVPVADSVFNVSIPKNLPVVDLFGPRVDAVTGSYKAELARLNADPNARRLLTIGTSGHKGSSCGTWFHPDFRFEVLGKSPVAVYYLADRNVYRILGEARAYNEKERWYSEPVENGDIRLPGEPRIEVVLMVNGKPGDFCGTEPSSMYRLQNMGPGNATITYHRIKDAYVIRGTARVLPIGKVYTDDVVSLDTKFGRDVAECIDSGSKLEWGDLPKSEIESMKADLDVALRLAKVRRDGNRIDGEEYYGLYGGGSRPHGVLIEPAGPGTRAWILDVPSKSELHVIGRARVHMKGKPNQIVKNGVVDYDGNVLSSEE
jgi:outer membrane lipoprotein-sorting protein